MTLGIGRHVLKPLNNHWRTPASATATAKATATVSTPATSASNMWVNDLRIKEEKPTPGVEWQDQSWTRLILGRFEVLP